MMARTETHKHKHARARTQGERTSANLGKAFPRTRMRLPPHGRQCMHSRKGSEASVTRTSRPRVCQVMACASSAAPSSHPGSEPSVKELHTRRAPPWLEPTCRGTKTNVQARRPQRARPLPETPEAASAKRLRWELPSLPKCEARLNSASLSPASVPQA